MGAKINIINREILFTGTLSLYVKKEKTAILASIY